jgi:hypothetical protein
VQEFLKELLKDTGTVTRIFLEAKGLGDQGTGWRAAYKAKRLGGSSAEALAIVLLNELVREHSV